VRRAALYFLLTGLFFLTSSCFVKTRRVHFAATVPLASTYSDINKDSLRLRVSINPRNRNFVIPAVIFRTNKSKANIRLSVQGKGISAREYSVQYQNLVITEGDSVIGKSTDPALFSEQVTRDLPRDAVSPLYGTNYLLKLPKPGKRNLKVHLEFELKSKTGLKEAYSFDLPLERIDQKSFTLFKF